MQLLIYALGGGLGHVVRSLALGRSFDRRGHSVTIMSNSHFAMPLLDRSLWSVPAAPRISLRLLDSSCGPKQALRAVQQNLADMQPDMLLVDTFPRGIGGELANLIPNLEIPAALVSRCLDRHYSEVKNLKEFVSHFDLLLHPGEAGISGDKVVETDAWLACEPRELFARGQARLLLAVPQADQRPVVVVQGCGRTSECSEAARLALELHRRLGSLAVVRFACLLNCFTEPIRAIQIRRWPLMALAAGIDLIVGSGGYNSVYESRATRTKFLGIPRRRMYDRQDQRLTSQETAPPNGDTILGMAKQALVDASATRDPRFDYLNGTHLATTALEELVDPITL